MRLGGFLALEAAALWAASFFGDFTRPGASLRFVLLMFVAGGLFLLAVRRFKNTAASAAGVGEPIGPSPIIFWSGALLLRLAMLGCEPGDDFWRYLWEGRIQLHGFNPYTLAPTAPELAALRDVTWTKINHPDAAAIYPPLAQLAFHGITRVTPSVLGFKLVFVAADLLTCALLIRLCAGGLRDAAWYAWNPAVVYAFAGGAHYDSLMLLPMTASLAILHISLKERAPLRWSAALGSCALLGAAIAIKFVPALLIPAWTRALRGKSAALALCAVIPALCSLTFGGIATVLSPLGNFANTARFNDTLWWAIEAFTGPNPYQRNWPFILALGGAILWSFYRFKNDWPRCAFWSMGSALVLSPVLHPWYVTWILPLACWRRSAPWSVFSLSVLGALLLWESTPLWNAWEPNLITRAIVLIPALAAWHWKTPLRQLSKTTNPFIP